MESAGHKWIVVWGVAENDELSVTERIDVGGSLGYFANNRTHKRNSVHIQTGTGRTDVHGCAHEISARQSLWQRADKKLFGRGHALGYESRETAEEVDAYSFCSAVEGLANLYVIVGGLACAGANQRNRGNRDALVDDGNAVIALNLFAYLNKVLGIRGDFGVNLLADCIDVVANAVEQRNTHSNGAHVELFLLDHLVGLVDLHNIQHEGSSLDASEQRLRCGASW